MSIRPRGEKALMTINEARLRAELVLAKLLLITGPVDHYEENIEIIQDAILESWNAAIKKSAEVVSWDSHFEEEVLKLSVLSEGEEGK